MSSTSHLSRLKQILTYSTIAAGLVLPTHAWADDAKALLKTMSDFPEALDAFLDEMRKAVPAQVQFEETDVHINAPEFAAKALAIFDQWVADGVVPRGQAPGGQP